MISSRLLTVRNLCKQSTQFVNLSIQSVQDDNGKPRKPKMVQYRKVNYNLSNVHQRSKSLSQLHQQNYSISSSHQASPKDNDTNDQDVTSGSTRSDSDSKSPITPTVAKVNVSHISKKPNNSESRERLTNIRQFYADQSIDKLSEKTLVRLNPISMMYMGVSDDNSHLLKTANYLRHELPIRVAHLIKEIRHLPFIIAVNPHILEIHERCIKTFHTFDNFDRVIRDKHAEKEFSGMVFNMLEMNKDLLGLLCDGFKESRRYIQNEDYIRKNLTRILSARLGIRLLCEHFIALNKHSEQRLTDTEYVGIIHKRFSPKKLIEKSGRMVTRICTEKYGMAPKLKVDGHTNVEFPYLSLPLEYILPELLKNSFRATCENHRDSPILPDVTVTISVNDKDCIIRLRDRGGGIPHELCEKIFDYHFTTVNEENKDDDFSLSTDSSAGDSAYNNAMGMICEASSSRGLAVMHGYGFGLPTSRAYAEYLGGSLTFQSMQGIGSDFYLRIALVDNQPGRVRI